MSAHDLMCVFKMEFMMDDTLNVAVVFTGYDVEGNYRAMTTAYWEVSPAQLDESVAKMAVLWFDTYGCADATVTVKTIRA